LPAWCESEEQGISPQDSKILMQLAAALRQSCGVEATLSLGEVASSVAEKDPIAVGAPAVGNETREQTPQSP
jgi:hypothetical protein